MMIAMRAAERLFENRVDNAKAQQVLGREAQRLGGFLSMRAAFPQNACATFGTDDRVIGVFEDRNTIAYANAQAAWGRLYNSLGMDIDAADSQVPVRALAVRIRHSLLRWEARTFATVAADPLSALPIALDFDGVEGGARTAVQALFADELRRRQVQVVDGPHAPDAWRLRVRRRIDALDGVAADRGVLAAKRRLEERDVEPLGNGADAVPLAGSDPVDPVVEPDRPVPIGLGQANPPL